MLFQCHVWCHINPPLFLMLREPWPRKHTALDTKRLGWEPEVYKLTRYMTLNKSEPLGAEDTEALCPTSAAGQSPLHSICLSRASNPSPSFLACCLMQPRLDFKIKFPQMGKSQIESTRTGLCIHSTVIIIITNQMLFAVHSRKENYAT